MNRRQARTSVLSQYFSEIRDFPLLTKEEEKQLARAVDPHVRAIVSSGYSNDPVMANHTIHGFMAAVKKPYRMQEISRVLHEVIKR